MAKKKSKSKRPKSCQQTLIQWGVLLAILLIIGLYLIINGWASAPATSRRISPSATPRIVSTVGPPASTRIPTITPRPPTRVPAASGAVSCGGATTCGQMVSCEQAYACLAGGQRSLDKDEDGVPCESICPGG